MNRAFISTYFKLHTSLVPFYLPKPFLRFPSVCANESLLANYFWILATCLTKSCAAPPNAKSLVSLCELIFRNSANVGFIRPPWVWIE
jgi:hypothetical protein